MSEYGRNEWKESEFYIDVSGIKKGLGVFEDKANAVFKVYAETVAKNFEGYAKEHRPWTDRTSRARLGLTGYVKAINNGYRIVLAHTVDYGVWLEMAMNKNYAILEPTVRLKGNDAVQGMQYLLNRIGR